MMTDLALSDSDRTWPRVRSAAARAVWVALRFFWAAIWAARLSSTRWRRGRSSGWVGASFSKRLRRVSSAVAAAVRFFWAVAATGSVLMAASFWFSRRLRTLVA